MGGGNFGAPPSIEALLAEWWGGPPADPLFTFNPGLASNLAFGGNPLYQVSDFLNTFPKFGTYVQAIASGAVVNGGTGYAVNDVLVPTQSGGSGASLVVTAVDGAGAVTALQISAGGQGYSVANGLAVTGGTGTGATINITALAAPNLLKNLSLPVLQVYITLANASLQQARWLDYWYVGMGLFVAHFISLFLLSDGNGATTPGQAAAQALSRGLVVSKSAGDVSVSYQVTPGLESWGAWLKTEYGQQLATFAKVIGMGPSYVY
jgi:hypothetical protein